MKKRATSKRRSLDGILASSRQRTPMSENSFAFFDQVIDHSKEDRELALADIKKAASSHCIEMSEPD